MVLAHPERAEALIVQDAVAHNEGLGANWKVRTNLLSLAMTRTRHLGSDPDVERYDADLWTDEDAFLNRPGQIEMRWTSPRTRSLI